MLSAVGGSADLARASITRSLTSDCEESTKDAAEDPTDAEAEEVAEEEKVDAAITWTK